MAPEQSPSTEILPRCSFSTTAQARVAVAAPSVVVMKAWRAMPSAARAEPALKPYQPAQSRPVPMTQSTILCGVIGRLPKPARGPTRMQSSKADQPEVMWTTIPPAKSAALKAASALAMPEKCPVAPQTACAMG